MSIDDYTNEDQGENVSGYEGPEEPSQQLEAPDVSDAADEGSGGPDRSEPEETETVGTEGVEVETPMAPADETIAQPVAIEFSQYQDAAAQPAAPMPEAGVGGGAQPGAKGGFFARLLSSNTGRIGLGVVAAALVMAVLFGTHVICFHEWSEPTCTEPSICSICGRTQGEPLGHDWKEATCTEAKTCQRCHETEGEALGHSVTKWVVTTEATCTKAGVESGECDRCGQAQTREIPMVDHEFGDWHTTKEATCTEKGERARECKNCGKTETEALDMVDHTPGDWVVTKQAEPTLGGGSTEGERTRSCTVCGKVLDTETYTLSDEELRSSYVASCESPSFEDVARYPDDWEGRKAKFTGEVIQVMQDGNEYTLRVNVTDTGYYWTDTIMVYYEASDGSPRILEDDVMTFYGVMSGMHSYESVLGATITVPLMLAVYAE